jgi:DNA (cytosine-5)-methyltransferase 1
VRNTKATKASKKGSSPTRVEPLEYVSLFSGAMGLDLGLESAGFRPVVVNEIDEAAVATIRANRPELPVLTKSIAELRAKDFSAAAGKNLRGIDLVVGGPPCQAFSVFGQRKGILDTRGVLVFEFIRVIAELKPKFFLMENVRGLHSMPAFPKSALKDNPSIDPSMTQPGSLLRLIFERFEQIGYRVDGYLVNSVNYGAPQIRERLLCIGNRCGLKVDFPQPTHSNRPADGLPPFRTLGDAIGAGFSDPDPSSMEFSARKLKYLGMVPPGGNWRSLAVEIQKESMGKAWFLKGGRSAYWRRLSFDFPSPTVVTMPNHAGTSMCHPTETRALTVGELAAVQEFPRDWRFVGTPTEKCRQIGNAVPPRLGRVAGEAISAAIRLRESQGVTRSKAPSAVEHLRPHVRTRSFFKRGKALKLNASYYAEENTLFSQVK